MAYQVFFALIPMLALVVGVLGFVYGPERAQREFVDALRAVYPSANAQEVRIARELVGGRAISLGIGLVGTIFAAGAVYGAIDTSLALVLGSSRTRGFVRGRLEGFAFIGAIALIAVISFALSYGAQAAQGALADAGLPRTGRAIVTFGSPLLGLGAGWLFFYSIYRYVPRVPVSGRAARTSALVSAVLWEVAKVAFGFFTRALGAFSAYGPIAFAAGLLTWVYLTAVIILLGAELMKIRMRVVG